MSTLLHLSLGAVFGFILSRSGAADYDQIQAMFRLESFQLYGIMGTAIVVTAPGLWVLRRYGRTATGAPLTIREKPAHAGNVVGGALFGVGWSVTGLCPGPIMVNLGEGKVHALAALAGALVGAGLLSAVYPRLSGPLRLPPLDQGAGDG